MSATPRLLSFAELEKLIRKGQESNSTANKGARLWASQINCNITIFGVKPV